MSWPEVCLKEAQASPLLTTRPCSFCPTEGVLAMQNTQASIQPVARHRRRAAVGPQPVADERRSQMRLRALCEEVLASYRVASDVELFSDAERDEARALLARVMPPHRP